MKKRTVTYESRGEEKVKFLQYLEKELADVQVPENFPAGTCTLQGLPILQLPRDYYQDGNDGRNSARFGLLVIQKEMNKKNLPKMSNQEVLKVVLLLLVKEYLEIVEFRGFVSSYSLLFNYYDYLYKIENRSQAAAMAEAK